MDSSVIYDELTANDEVTTDTMVLLNEMNSHLENIEQGINHIFLIGLLIILWLALLKVFGKWYLGGV